MPLLGIVMSEFEFLLKMYSLTVVDSQWKIAEVDVMRCPVTANSFHRLVHVMTGWTKHCCSFLTSSTPLRTFNPNLILHRHSNVVSFDGKIYKCYDYRQISERSDIEMTQRRNADMYTFSDLTDIEVVVNWASDRDAQDSLKIISYHPVPGVHYPSVAGHMILVMKKILNLKSRNIVHGDLRLANIVFSDPESIQKYGSVQSTIIDFDYSGIEGEKCYPERFNVDITDGFRHAGARPCELLRHSHDIAAIHWFMEQYKPKDEQLQSVWSLCLEDLNANDLPTAIERLGDHSLAELELVAKVGAAEMNSEATGSPEVKRGLLYV